jgi:hypothetical protein
VVGFVGRYLPASFAADLPWASFTPVSHWLRSAYPCSWIPCGLLAAIHLWPPSPLSACGLVGGSVVSHVIRVGLICHDPPLASLCAFRLQPHSWICTRPRWLRPTCGLVRGFTVGIVRPRSTHCGLDSRNSPAALLATMPAHTSVDIFCWPCWPRGTPAAS